MSTSTTLKLFFSLYLLTFLALSYSQETQFTFEEAQFDLILEEETEEVLVNCEVECPEGFLEETVNGVQLNFKPCCFRSYSSCESYSNGPICIKSRRPCQDDGCYQTRYNACMECSQDPTLYYAKEACPEDPDIEEECPVPCPDAFVTREIHGVELDFKPCCFGDCVDCNKYHEQSICAIDVSCQGQDCVKTMSNACLECQIDGNLFYSRGACPEGGSQGWGEEDPLVEEWHAEDLWDIEQEIVIVSDEEGVEEQE